MFPSLNTFFWLSCESKDMRRQIKADWPGMGKGHVGRGKSVSKDGEADCVASTEDRGHMLLPDRELMKEESRRLGLSGGAMAPANPRTY